MTIIDSTNTDATDPPKSDAQQVASNASTADPNKSKHSLTNENEDTSNSTPESDSLANSKQTQISNSTQSSSSSPLQYIGESDPVTPLETSDAFPGSLSSPQPTGDSETGSKAISDSSLSTENLTPQSLDSPQSSSASPSVETLAKSKGPVFTEMAADASSSALVSNPTSKDPVSPPPGSNDPVTAVKPTTKQPSLFHIVIP